MICKTKGRLGRNKRHVAIDAVAPALSEAFGLVQCGGTRVALQTLFVEECRWFRNSGFVRIMASEAGERAAAFQEATTLAEIDGLVANVPGIIPIDGVAFRGRRTMAGAAKVIQLRS